MNNHMRQCPRCGVKSRRLNCCGIDLGFRRRWRMTTELVRQIQIIARLQKGLDDETYRLHLAAVGADSCKRLSRDQHYALLQRLTALPDAPRWMVFKKPRRTRVKPQSVAGAMA